MSLFFIIIAPVAIVIAICVAIVRKVSIEKKDVKNENNKDSNDSNKKTDKSLTIAIGGIIVGIIIAIAAIYLIKQDNITNNNDEPKLLTRNATLNDLTITSDDFDISSFGEKLTFNPKKDIDGLKLKFVFQKSNGTKIQTIEKPMGNVKEGQQYSITISILELSWEVIKNADDMKCKYTVSAGTISYFA